MNCTACRVASQSSHLKKAADRTFRSVGCFYAKPALHEIRIDSCGVGFLSFLFFCKGPRGKLSGRPLQSRAARSGLYRSRWQCGCNQPVCQSGKNRWLRDRRCKRAVNACVRHSAFLVDLLIAIDRLLQIRIDPLCRCLRVAGAQMGVQCFGVVVQSANAIQPAKPYP